MSRQIIISEDNIEEMKERFARYLESGRFKEGKVEFKASLGNSDRKATIRFSELAWHKMHALVRDNSKEVGWHGFAERYGDPENDEYYISDLVVYPQVVTAASIEPDEKEYTDWLMSLTPEQHSSLRFQGHSHVNMGTSPSSTDTTYYQSILNQLGKDMFYIFAIWNKRDESTCFIYDMAKNLFFDDKDISIIVDDDGLGLESFVAEAEKKVTVYKAPEKPAYKGGYWGLGKSSKEDKPVKSENLQKEKSLSDYYKNYDYYTDDYLPGWRDI